MAYSTSVVVLEFSYVLTKMLLRTSKPALTEELTIKQMLVALARPGWVPNKFTVLLYILMPPVAPSSRLLSGLYGVPLSPYEKMSKTMLLDTVTLLLGAPGKMLIPRPPQPPVLTFWMFLTTLALIV